MEALGLVATAVLLVVTIGVMTVVDAAERTRMARHAARYVAHRTTGRRRHPVRQTFHARKA